MWDGIKNKKIVLIF